MAQLSPNSFPKKSKSPRPGEPHGWLRLAELSRRISKWLGDLPICAADSPKRIFLSSQTPFPEIEKSNIFKNPPNFDQTHFLRKVGPPGPGNPTAGSASPRQCVGFQNGWEISRYVPLVARNDFLSSGSPFPEIEKSDMLKNEPRPSLGPISKSQASSWGG